MSSASVLCYITSESMREQLNSFLEAKNGVSLTFVSTVSDCLSLIMSGDNDYQLIISSYEHPDLLCENIPIPVITIDTSFQDISRAVKLSKNYNFGSRAFIGSEHLCNIAADAAEFLQVDLIPVAIDYDDTPDSAANRIKDKGISLIIASPEICTAAQELGIAGIPLIPSAGSVANAAEKALAILSAVSKCNRLSNLRQFALSSLDLLLILLDESGNCVYRSSTDPAYNSVYNIIIQEAPPEHSSKTVTKIGANYWEITKKRISFDNERYTHIVAKKEPYDFEDSAMRGVMIATHSDLSKHEITESYLNSVGNMRQIVEAAQNYARLSSPTIIFGEPGVGKNIFADIVHKHCAYKERHVVVLDCEQVELPTWTKLLNDSSSVFHENNVVFYFKNCEMLPLQIQPSILQFMSRLVNSNQNKLMLSCNCGASLPDNYLFSYLTERLHASEIFVPPLRSRLTELENLSSIYINSLSVELGSRVIGFENNAHELLKDYDWPGNLNQFRRFIAELIVSSHGYYISRETVLAGLKRENSRSVYFNSEPNDMIDLSGTLEEIERRVILRILSEEHQNQSAAAKRLGISRSTLWRKLS